MCSNRVMIKFLKAGKRLYHKFGIKHYLIFGFYFCYLVVGATVFYILEHDAAEEFNWNWKESLERNRSEFLKEEILPRMFNNSKFLVFISDEKSEGYLSLLDRQLAIYERKLGLRPPTPILEWDFLNAILYACTVTTTIGYGHIYPMTDSGKVATMIFSALGLPITLLVLRNFVSLLTKLLNYPGLLLAKCWDVFRFCTLRAINEEALRVKNEFIAGRRAEVTRRSIMIETMLSIPTIVAVFALIGWIFAGAFTFCLWERDWTVLTGFYFCFNSLSTVGLGDVVPTDPKLHLLMFFYVFVGLAVVSLFINLVHVKVSRAYWLELAAAERNKRIYQNDPELNRAFVESFLDEETSISDMDLGSCVTLGILQMQERRPLLCPVQKESKMTQTTVTLPIKRTVHVEQNSGGGGHVYLGSRSMDDVNRLLREVYD